MTIRKAVELWKEVREYGRGKATNQLTLLCACAAKEYGHTDLSSVRETVKTAEIMYMEAFAALMDNPEVKEIVLRALPGRFHRNV